MKRSPPQMGTAAAKRSGRARSAITVHSDPCQTPRRDSVDRAEGRMRGAVGTDHGEAGDILALGIEGVTQLRLHRVQDLVDRLDVHAWPTAAVSSLANPSDP